MLSSMTGFVSRTLNLSVSPSETVQLTIAIKTLNSRFFESTCRLTPVLSSLETDLIKRGKEILSRGHMYLTMNVSNPNCFKSDVTLSLSTVKGYLDSLTKAQKVFGLSGSVNVSDILHIPNVFISEELPVNDAVRKQIMDDFTQALHALNKTRAAEGASLLIDFKKRTAIMAEHITAIEKAFEIVHQQAKKDLETKLTTVNQSGVDHTAIQGLMLYSELDKIDIHEEIVRFNTHLKSFATLLEAKQDEKGRQLDFILQELAREINTIVSKCPHSPISTFAITIKVEIEKCREQVQNIV